MTTPENADQSNEPSAHLDQGGSESDQGATPDLDMGIQHITAGFDKGDLNTKSDNKKPE
ncbi:hypothetical protein Pan97_48570 [Bremerella volcania]|uniref:Uncharacterized protein n=1 Tax=Bremerella volcania TaxID=2527984 RepID=A0A518CEW8_9BACT|nr:hypothetical protein [Bremerella volcania]QDU77778.1 hypothetical protein Pan97_48570 [Bremerella volcania]